MHQTAAPPSRAAAGDALTLDGRKKPRTPITFRQRERIWLLRASGSVAAGRNRFSRDMALSSGGAVVSGAFDQRGPIAARAVGEGQVLNRSPGAYRFRWRRLGGRGSFAQRRDRGARVDRPGHVNGRVVQAPAPSLVHPGRVVRIIGLVSHRGVTSPNRVAAVGGG